MFSYSAFRSGVIAAALTLVHLVAAQSNTIIPQDLTAGFAESSVDLQVSYVGKPTDGFRDGSTFTREAVTSMPQFALGDSSGISPLNRYTIVMIDATCDSSRSLLYAQTNFKVTTGVRIESTATPLMPYMAPGTFAEGGDGRQYAFLMFENPQRAELSTLTLPGAGEPFNLDTFMTDNGFEPPVAGVGMVVQLGGETVCDGTPVQAPAAPVVAAPTSAAPPPPLIPISAVSSIAPAIGTVAPAPAPVDPAGVSSAPAVVAAPAVPTTLSSIVVPAATIPPPTSSVLMPLPSGGAVAPETVPEVGSEGATIVEMPAQA